MPTPTYVALAKTVLTGTQATVTFSSIVGTYTDLLLVISARSDFAADYDNYAITINSVTTSYSNTRLEGNGSAANSNTGTFRVYAWRGMTGNTATSNTFSNGEFYFANYAGATNKTISYTNVTENNSALADKAYIVANAALWSNTSAITSLSIGNGNGSFVSGSRFDLYGIKNS